MRATIQPFQFDNLGVALLLWVGLYTADYYLTIYGSRLWRLYAQPYLSFDGSYELNPIFQNDIDQQRKFSQRFFLMLVFFAFWLVMIWAVGQWLKFSEIFPLGAGFLLLMEPPVLARHLRNITLFNALKTPGSIEGHIWYGRSASLRITALELLYWTGLYLGLFLLTGSLLFVGGAASMFRLFIRFNRMSQQHQTNRRKPADQEPQSEVAEQQS